MRMRIDHLDAQTRSVDAQGTEHDKCAIGPNPLDFVFMRAQ